MEPNLAGIIYGRSFIKYVHFVPIRQQTWPPCAILNSDWLSFQKKFPVKPLGQMEPNFTGSIYGRSFIKFVHFIPIGQQAWPPWAILNSDWLSFQTFLILIGWVFKHFFLWNHLAKLNQTLQKHLWEVLYKVCSFHP